MRHAWNAALLALLIASNLCWIVVEPLRGSTRSSASAREIAEATRRVDALAADVASRKAVVAERARNAAAGRGRVEGRARAQPPTADEARRAAARKIAEPWIEALRQVDDDALRQRTLDEMRAALGDADPARVHAALEAFLGAFDVRFDRTPFRPAVTQLLSAADPQVRARALWAFVGLPAEPGDLDRVLPFVDDPALEVRRGVFHAVVCRCGGTLDGAAADAALRILADESLIDGALSSFGVRSVSATVEARLLELCAEPKWHDRVLRFGLCQIDEPSDAVFAILVDTAQQHPGDLQARALERICHPCLRAHWDRSAGVLLQLLEGADNPYVRADLLHKLHYIGDSRHAERLERAIAAGRFESDDKKLAETVAASLRKQPPRQR